MQRQQYHGIARSAFAFHNVINARVNLPMARCTGAPEEKHQDVVNIQHGYSVSWHPAGCEMAPRHAVDQTLDIRCRSANSGVCIELIVTRKMALPLSFSTIKYFSHKHQNPFVRRVHGAAYNWLS